MRRREFLGFLAVLTAAVACSSSATPATSPPAAAPKAAAPTPAPTTAPAAQPTAPPKPTRAAPATPKSLIKLRIAEIPGTADRAFSLLGIEKGFYREEGIDFVEVPINNGGAMVQGLIANELDAAELGPSPVFPAVEGSAPLMVVGAVRPKVTQVMMSRSDINGPADLVGKNVATGAPGAILYAQVLAYLREKGVDPDKVNFVALGTTEDNFKALQAGKVDVGLVNAEHTLLIRDNPNLKVLDDLSKVMPLFLRVSVVAHERLVKQPDALLSLLTGMARSVRYTIEHKDEFVKYGVEGIKLPAPQVEFSFDYDVKNRLIAPDLDFDPKAIDYSQQLNIQSGAQKTMLPFDRVATLEFQQKVVAKLGKYQWKS